MKKKLTEMSVKELEGYVERQKEKMQKFQDGSKNWKKHHLRIVRATKQAVLGLSERKGVQK